jgi:hypothetical protein
MAPLEKIPELLYSKNFEQLFQIGRQTNILQLLDQEYWYSISGKMKDDVWTSPLAQWLRRRNEFDLLPWREFILLRVCDLSENGFPLSENVDRLGMETEFNTSGSDPQKRLVLPTEPEDGGGVFCHRVIPFNFHTWKTGIPYFEPLPSYARLRRKKRHIGVLHFHFISREVSESAADETEDQSNELWTALEGWARACCADFACSVSRLKIPTLQAPGQSGIYSQDQYIVQAANVIVCIFADI